MCKGRVIIIQLVIRFSSSCCLHAWQWKGFDHICSVVCDDNWHTVVKSIGCNRTFICLVYPFSSVRPTESLASQHYTLELVILCVVSSNSDKWPHITALQQVNGQAYICNIITPQSVVTLSQLGGLHASQIPEAMPAGVLTPGRYNHAGQALG